jgi:hypothetical protein
VIRELRGAAGAAPRATPLTLVSAAVAGDGLDAVAAAAAAGAGCPVAIVLPGQTTPLVVRPETALAPAAARDLLAEAVRVLGGETPPRHWDETIPVRIGTDTVGWVLALGRPNGGGDRSAWLEGAAAAASVATVLEGDPATALAGARHAFLRTLAISPAADGATVIAQGQRLGVDLSEGAVAVCAAAPWAGAPSSLLLTELPGGRILGLLALAGTEDGAAVETMLAELRASGIAAAASLPQRDPALLHEALREAELLLALAAEDGFADDASQETYRMLIRLLLRDRRELEQLRAQTVSALERYDADHDTELLATLRCFLDHHGSTTEAAEAMRLHRHTVGYRLSRVMEVSGLSPHESDGRERLGLGLKAHRILRADARGSAR